MFCNNIVFTGLQQHSQSPNSTSVANGSTTNMLDQHNSDLPAKGISLHEHVLRWGEKKSIQDFNSLFSVTGVSVECKFKISPSGYCKKKCKAQQREGLWVISNFTKHFIDDHFKPQTSGRASVSTTSDITSLLGKRSDNQRSTGLLLKFSF